MSISLIYQNLGITVIRRILLKLVSTNVINSQSGRKMELDYNIMLLMLQISLFRFYKLVNFLAKPTSGSAG